MVSSVGYVSMKTLLLQGALLKCELEELRHKIQSASICPWSMYNPRLSELSDKIDQLSKYNLLNLESSIKEMRVYVQETRGFLLHRALCMPVQRTISYKRKVLKLDIQADSRESVSFQFMKTKLFEAALRESQLQDRITPIYKET
jgi:hypothetical protein